MRALIRKSQERFYVKLFITSVRKPKAKEHGDIGWPLLLSETARDELYALAFPPREEGLNGRREASRASGFTLDYFSDCHDLVSASRDSLKS